MQMSRFTGLLGIIVFLFLAYLFSTNRRAIRVKTVAWGLGLQFVFALAVIYSNVGQQIMNVAGAKVTRLLNYAFAGSFFVFGNLGLPADPKHSLWFLPSDWSKTGFIFAFQVLPTIIFISALFAVLYYFRSKPRPARRSQAQPVVSPFRLVEDRLHLRLSGAANNNFHLRAVCSALLLRDHAAHHPRDGMGDEPVHGSQRR